MLRTSGDVGRSCARFYLLFQPWGSSRCQDATNPRRFCPQWPYKPGLTLAAIILPAMKEKSHNLSHLLVIRRSPLHIETNHPLMPNFLEVISFSGHLSTDTASTASLPKSGPHISTWNIHLITFRSRLPLLYCISSCKGPHYSDGHLSTHCYDLFTLNMSKDYLCQT